MGDYTLPPRNTQVFGMTGSGKTSFAIKYLLNVPATCRFIFDDLGRFAVRLKLRPARTLRECEQSIAQRWVVFNPHTMFRGNPADAFKWFCEWSYEASRRGPGHKIFCVDEVWQWQTAHGIPDELKLLVTTGREEGLELLSCTQYPHQVNAAITGSATEIISFRLDEPLALQRLAALGMPARDVSALPLGTFIGKNRLTGGLLTGKMF
jgi:hypothetical protein